MDAVSPDGGERDGTRAAEVFVADLWPRPGGRLVQWMRLAGAALSELLMQLVPSPSVHDVVVTRRDDGTEVLRLPAGDPLLVGDRLARIRAERERLDPEAFLASWSASAPPAPGPSGSGPAGRLTGRPPDPAGPLCGRPPTGPAP